MSSEFIPKKLQEVLNFSNGRSSPERDEKFSVPVFGSNGLIGLANESNSPENTIVIGRVGTYCGSVHYSSESCWVTDNAIKATAKGDNSSLFLFYLLKHLNLNNWRSGSGQPLLNQATLNAIDVLMPSPEQQKEIALTIGNIDDRITLLRKTNATLEAIAQALFKSWFVDFDPVHAKQQGRAPEGMDAQTAALFPDSFEESELGMVPKGWKLEMLAEAYEINPFRKLSKGTKATYLDMANVPTQGYSVGDLVERDFGSGTKFKNNDTLLARITPCLENGKTAYVDFLKDDAVAWGSTEFIVLRPKAPLPPFHAYLLCRSKSFREHAIQSMSGTSGRQRVQNDMLGMFQMAGPSKEVAVKFAEIAGIIQAQSSANEAQAKSLAQLRDTLLPRLISGQLRLPEAQALVKETEIL